ncbi:TPA: glutamine amidotransferase, partial [Klebsiella pneumoniae]|nr:glutamine amidotransferase [Klebsiella pneumoniae]
VVERLIAHSEKDLSRAAEYRFVDTPEALRAHDYSEMNQVLFGFLDKLEARYTAAQA